MLVTTGKTVPNWVAFIQWCPLSLFGYQWKTPVEDADDDEQSSPCLHSILLYSSRDRMLFAGASARARPIRENSCLALPSL